MAEVATPEDRSDAPQSRLHAYLVAAALAALAAALAIGAIIAAGGSDDGGAPYFRDDPEAMLESYSPAEVAFVQDVKGLAWGYWFPDGWPTVLEMLSYGNRACEILAGESNYDHLYRLHVMEGRPEREWRLWKSIAESAEQHLC